MEILKVEDLTKVYGSGANEVRALDHVSFTVKKGEFTAIVGSSGSGKSTLLHLIGGVDTPTSGKVYVDGTDVYAQNEDALAVFRRRQVGLIYQFYNLIPVLSVRENITLPVLMDGRDVNEERVEELLSVLKLKRRENHLPNQLSGGQQQRVSIGRALMNAPALLLADEPTGNLDSKNSREIMQLLRYSNEKYHQTMLVITHDEDIALQADRILSLEDGRIVRDEVIRRDHIKDYEAEQDAHRSYDYRGDPLYGDDHCGDDVWLQYLELPSGLQYTERRKLVRRRGLREQQRAGAYPGGQPCGDGCGNGYSRICQI